MTNKHPAPTPVPEAAATVTIGAVERDTGLSKDVLRMWERRYHFPVPQRDAHGERVYPPEQVTKLRALKRLMDQGHRPGKIIGMTLEDLAALNVDRASALRTRDRDVDEVLQLIGEHRLPELRQRLNQLLLSKGLQRFVVEIVKPLNVEVGEAWSRGDLAIFEEHLYAEQIQSLLRYAIGSVQARGDPPRVLLTSFPTEQHCLGLLMAESMLVVEGVTCVALGTETPLPDIVRAASAHQADIVALSFSAAYPERQAVAGLRELRALLPANTALWVGGSGVSCHRRPLDGVVVVDDIERIASLVADWRTEHRGNVHAAD